MQVDARARPFTTNTTEKNLHGSERVVNFYGEKVGLGEG